MNDVNIQFFVSLSIIIIGYISKRINLLSEKNGEVLAKLILNITLPALILNTFSQIEINFQISIMTLINLVYSFLLCLIAFFLFRKYIAKAKGLLIIGTIGFNIGLFAYPMIEAILGKEGLTHIAMFDLGNTFIVFGLSYIIACIFSQEAGSVNVKYIIKKLIRLVPLWSYIIAITLNIIGFRFPLILGNIFEVLSRANAGLVFILLGIYLNFKFDIHHWKMILRVLSLRYISGILVGLLLYNILPFSSMFRGVMFIGFILPVGMIVVPYSIEFAYDKKLAGAFVNISNIISFILMWVLSVLLKF